MSNWSLLPAEIRNLILEFLLLHKGIAPYASVSTEWRKVIEKRTFGHLMLHPSDLDALDQIANRHNDLVEHLFLNIEHRQYDCESCDHLEPDAEAEHNRRVVTNAIARLFFVISTWDHNNGRKLTLELNVYSPSDSEHWFRGCYFGIPGEVEPEYLPQDNITIHDPEHGWYKSRVIEKLPEFALLRLFDHRTVRFEQTLHIVPAVTRFLLRRQCRRQPRSMMLSELLSRFPRLEEMSYEPWRPPDACSLSQEDPWLGISIARLPETVRKITIFEDYNQNYLDQIEGYSPIARVFYVKGSSSKTPKGFAEALIMKSLQLEHLSVAFLIDAFDFFSSYNPHLCWSRLQSLTLTSRLMNQANVNELLHKAAMFALNMPKLETMTIWYGGKREACAFTYSREEVSVTWRGTWDVDLEPLLLEAWERVTGDSRKALCFKKELLACDIVSHGDAIHYLGLNHVVDDLSLRQIRQESRYRWVGLDR
ncbi:hypothetical protein FGRMN_2340 [Fusarium graminum]|nr:hypothetical protein FGRMN_2340 [Fusarium graminum]